ncbi:hypothetical protein AB0M97_13905 [Streptomyces sp. NPDC051207]|uniref:hypothetical protein n=1 Tax=Streptomyces sp. NPDC051207 TaxID=3154641 RepID=UPI003443E9D3
MLAIDQLLARARLRHQPDVPADTIPHEDHPYLDQLPEPATTPTCPTPTEQAAAQHLHTLCETAVTTLTPDDLTFLTDQIPEHHSAWLLGCALHLAGIEDGARFWWQYAAGDGHPPACYSLSLHHLARGESHAAVFYARQTGLDTAAEAETLTVAGTCPPRTIRFDAGLSTVLRILSRLASPGHRRRPHRIDALTNYVADAVTPHYTRHPGVELPVPEPRFADRVGFLLETTPPWETRTPRTGEPALPTRTHHDRITDPEPWTPPGEPADADPRQVRSLPRP